MDIYWWWTGEYAPTTITKAKLIDHFYDIKGYWTEYKPDLKDILEAIKKSKQELKDNEEKERLEKVTRRPAKGEMQPIATPEEEKKEEQPLPPEIAEKIERLEKRVADLSLGDEQYLPDNVYAWPRKVTHIKRMDLKARQKLLKAVPKFEDLIPEAVTRDPAKVTQKFCKKEALTMVTKTLQKLYKQVMGVYKMCFLCICK